MTRTPPSIITSSAPATSRPRGASALRGGIFGCMPENITASRSEESSSGKCDIIAALTVYCTVPSGPSACAVKFSTIKSGSCRVLPSARGAVICTNWFSQNVSATNDISTASGRTGRDRTLTSISSYELTIPLMITSFSQYGPQRNTRQILKVMGRKEFCEAYFTLITADDAPSVANTMAGVNNSGNICGSPPAG